MLSLLSGWMPSRDVPVKFQLKFTLLYSLLIRCIVKVKPCREITPAQAFGIIAERNEKRIQVLRNVRMESYNVTISELDLIVRQVRKAQAYFVSIHSETTVRKP